MAINAHCELFDHNFEVFGYKLSQVITTVLNPVIDNIQDEMLQGRAWKKSKLSTQTPISKHQGNKVDFLAIYCGSVKEVTVITNKDNIEMNEFP